MLRVFRHPNITKRFLTHSMDCPLEIFFIYIKNWTHGVLHLLCFMQVLELINMCTLWSAMFVRYSRECRENIQMIFDARGEGDDPNLRQLVHGSIHKEELHLQREEITSPTNKGWRRSTFLNTCYMKDQEDGEHYKGLTIPTFTTSTKDKTFKLINSIIYERKN